MGFWEFGGERVGTGEVSLQATWERDGRILSQLGRFQVSRRGLKREQRGTKQSQQGEAPCIVVHCNLCIYRMIETFE